jgi:hypothetical protein
LPDNVPLVVAALVEPLSAAWYIKSGIAMDCVPRHRHV